MKAPHPAYAYATPNINHLRRGEIYRAITRCRTVVGEYLGMETPHGDRAILLRHGDGTDSIALCSVISILSIAA